MTSGGTAGWLAAAGPQLNCEGRIWSSAADMDCLARRRASDVLGERPSRKAGTCPRRAYNLVRVPRPGDASETILTMRSGDNAMEPTAEPIRLAGSVLSRSCHVCAFFHSKEEEYEVLMPFIKE